MKPEKEEHNFPKGRVQVFEMETDLEKALELAGAGKYQFFHCAQMVATLSAAVLEMIGCSFVLPAAACDLAIPEHLRGILASISNIGIIATAPFWGRAADTVGRKPILLASSLAAGVFGFLAAFTPNLISFVFCKLAGSFFLSCPTSLGFAYAGELMPRQRRDFAILVCNGLVTLLAALSPIVAWGVLSFDWQVGPIAVAPWRVLTAAYAMPLLLAALWVTQAKESPKYLVARGKEDQALEVLRHIYTINTGQTKDSFCVTQLIKSAGEMEEPVDRTNGNAVRNASFLSLLQPPHLKWLTLTGFLMFGLFSVLNGLFLFVPDTINKIMSHSSEKGGNLCMLMDQALNKTSDDLCVDHISFNAFYIMVVMGVLCGALAVALSFTRLSKKTLLVTMFFVVGATSLVSELTENRIVAGVAMSTMQVTALGVGPLASYAVHLFPTSLRSWLFVMSFMYMSMPPATVEYLFPNMGYKGTAVGAVLMLGRVGSVVGSVVTGRFLPTACDAAVFGFTTLLFLCAGLSFLLPRDDASHRSR